MHRYIGSLGFNKMGSLLEYLDVRRKEENKKKEREKGEGEKGHTISFR